MPRRPSEKPTINGAPVTEGQIEAWASEAEAGYSVEHLRRRGRPPVGDGPTTVVPVRIDEDLLEALEEQAHAQHLSRSEAIRTAIRVWVGVAS